MTGRWLEVPEAYDLLTGHSDLMTGALQTESIDDINYFRLEGREMPDDPCRSVHYANGSVDGFWLNWTQGVNAYVCGVFVHDEEAEE